MKKILLACLLILLTVSCAGKSFAQEPDTDTKWKLYNAESKNPWLAVGAAWFLPTAGHAYAGNWGRGLPFLGVEAASLALMMSSINNTGTSVNTSQYGLAVGALLVARVWEYFDAYATAEDANKELKQKYGITFLIRDSAPGLALSCSF
jgi:hypothetical protein